MGYISLMVLAMQTRLKKQHQKKQPKKKSHAHCCLLFSLFDDFIWHTGYSNSA